MPKMELQDLMFSLMAFGLAKLVQFFIVVFQFFPFRMRILLWPCVSHVCNFFFFILDGLPAKFVLSLRGYFELGLSSNADTINTIRTLGDGLNVF
jgi:hypothetical protein